MKLNDFLSKNFNPLTIDQQREIKARLRFASVDTDNLTESDVELVKEAAARVLRQNAQVRTASVHTSTHGCPRCGSATVKTRLADGEQAAYCNACRVVVPE